MGDAATLITAIAALVTAIGGATAAIIVALRSGGRQRAAAAAEGARLGLTAKQRGPQGDHDSSPRHRKASSGRPDALVERLEKALELARAADDLLDHFDGDDSDDDSGGDSDDTESDTDQGGEAHGV